MGKNYANCFIVKFQCESKRCLIIGNIYFIKLRIVPVTQYLNSEIQDMLHAINLKEPMNHILHEQDFIFILY